MTIKQLIIDMDGVLWHGETPLPSLNEFFEALETLKLPFVLATNNATKTTEQYLGKFGRFGLRVEPEQILTSAVATASYARSTYPSARTAFLIADDGLQQAMTLEGFERVLPNAVAEGGKAELVVGGLSRNVTYQDFAMATVLVCQGVPFLISNGDKTFPSEWGLLPGAGSVLSVITTATGVEPTVVGKPEPIMFKEALKRLGAIPQETLMVGDRLDTDILGAQRLGIQTALVLSGVSRREDVEAVESKPDLVVEDIATLGQILLNK